jgi:hypothetical protein
VCDHVPSVSREFNTYYAVNMTGSRVVGSRVLPFGIWGFYHIFLDFWQPLATWEVASQILLFYITDASLFR